MTPFHLAPLQLSLESNFKGLLAESIATASNCLTMSDHICP